jgi:hypothetical protein
MKNDDDDIQEYEYNRKYIRHQIAPREPTRNEVLEEVAKAVYEFKAFEKDTMDSFVAYIRSMKR